MVTEFPSCWHGEIQMTWSTFLREAASSEESTPVVARDDPRPEMIRDVQRYWAWRVHVTVSKLSILTYFDHFWSILTLWMIVSKYCDELWWIVMDCGIFSGSSQRLEKRQPEARHHWRPCISFLLPRPVEGHSEVPIPQQTSILV